MARSRSVYGCRTLWILLLAIGWMGIGIPQPSAADTSPRWADNLTDSGGGSWDSRWILDVENLTPKPLTGHLWRVTAGPQSGSVNLAGHRTESVRICDPQGRELLFDLIDAAGCTRRSGTITEGDQLAFCLDLPAAKVTDGKTIPSTGCYVVYCGNPQAQAPADSLHAGLSNGGFEAGAKEPLDWQTATVDERHRLDWVGESPHSGTRCTRTIVAPGAEATWVQWKQEAISVEPKTQYRLTAWVKAKDIQGSAGWYVHVHAQQPMVVNQLANAGAGSYDWRMVTIDFQTPDNATTATVGTVLHGTGTAWFDDAALQRMAGTASIRLSRAQSEQRRIQEAPEDSKWRLPRDRWPGRIIVHATNPDAEPADHVVVSADIHRWIRLIAPPGQTVRTTVIDPTVSLGGKNDGTLLSTLLDKRLLFVASIPPQTRKAFHVYLLPSPEVPDGDRTAYSKLVLSPANRVKNPSFEDGGERPEGWQSDAETAEKAKPNRLVREKTGLVGPWCARFDLAPETAGQWFGWRQGIIPLQPGATYLYAGWIKTQNVRTGGATLHGHFYGPDGQLIKEQPFISTVGHATGDSGWKLLQTVTRAPDTAAGVTLHLTSNVPGTVWHDGILLCRTIEATIGTIERSAPEAESVDAPLRLWTVNPIVKVFRETAPGKQVTSLNACAAANEYEPIQCVLRSTRLLKNVVIEATAPIGPGGSLPPVQIDRVGYVPVDRPSSYYQSRAPAWCRVVPVGTPMCDGWAGDWPDPLLPCRPFDLAANQSQPIWLTVHVPTGTKTGLYVGEVTVRAEGLPDIRLPLNVEVWPFELPARPSLRVIYDLRSGPGWPGVAEGPIDMLRKWYELLASHRISPGILPQPGFKYDGGKVTMDTEAFDRSAKVLLDELNAGVFYSPDIFYAFGWAYKPRPFLERQAFTDEYHKAYTDCLRTYIEHLKRHGWYDRMVLYLSDEPFYTKDFVLDQMKKLCAMIKSVDPKLPIYSSTWVHVPAWNGVLTQWGVGQHGSFPTEEFRRRLDAGERIWLTTDGQQVLDTPYLATERILPYYCFKYGATGYEFWGVAWWTHNPWDKAWHTFIRQSDEGQDVYWIRYPNGDGYLTYPGERVGLDRPVSSIRLEQAREGLEDYEYLCILQDLIGKARGKLPAEAVVAGEKALERARAIVTIPNAGGPKSTMILPDPEAVPSARMEIARRIVAIKRCMP